MIYLRVIWEECKKHLKILLSYPLEIVYWIFFPIIWVIPFIFQGKAFVGGLSSQSFMKLTGSGQFIPFVLIGAIVSTFMFSAMYGVANCFRLENFWGTLEYILIAPVSKFMLFAGKSLFESLFSIVYALMQAGICVFVFGVELTLHKILPVLLIMSLLIIGLYGLGIALSGVTLIIKESHGLIHMLDNIFYLFSPIRYPVEINPVTRIISLGIPLTYALIAIRGIILLSKPLSALIKEILILILVDVILLGIGIYSFYICERKARLRGTLGHY